jgi:hypothetical protein
MGQYNRTNDHKKQKTWHQPPSHNVPKPKRGAKVTGTQTTGKKGGGGFVFFLIFLGLMALVVAFH